MINSVSVHTGDDHSYAIVGKKIIDYAVAAFHF